MATRALKDVGGVTAKEFGEAALKLCYSEGISRDELTELLAKKIGFKIPEGDRTLHKRVNLVLSGGNMDNDYSYVITNVLNEKSQQFLASPADVVAHARELPEFTEEAAQKAAIGFAKLYNMPLHELELEVSAPLRAAKAEGAKQGKLPEFKQHYDRAKALGFESLGEMLSRAPHEIPDYGKIQPVDIADDIGKLKDHLRNGHIYNTPTLGGFLDMNATQVSAMLTKGQVPERAMLLVHALADATPEEVRQMIPGRVEIWGGGTPVPTYERIAKMQATVKSAGGRKSASDAVDPDLLGRSFKALRTHEDTNWTMRDLAFILSSKVTAPEIKRIESGNIDFAEDAARIRAMCGAFNARDPKALIVKAAAALKIQEDEALAEQERRSKKQVEEWAKAERRIAESPATRYTVRDPEHVDGHNFAVIWKAINRHMVSENVGINAISARLKEKGVELPAEVMLRAKHTATKEGYDGTKTYLNAEAVHHIASVFSPEDGLTGMLDSARSMGAMTSVRMRLALERGLERGLDDPVVRERIANFEGRTEGADMTAKEIHTVATKVLGYESIADMLYKNREIGGAGQGSGTTIRDGTINPAQNGEQSWVERTAKSPRGRTSFPDF